MRKLPHNANVERQTMRISGPERYKLNFDSASFAVQCLKGTPKFSGMATSKKPKLYIVRAVGKPIYVGVTLDPWVHHRPWKRDRGNSAEILG